MSVVDVTAGRVPCESRERGPGTMFWLQWAALSALFIALTFYSLQLKAIPHAKDETTALTSVVSPRTIRHGGHDDAEVR